MLDLSKVATSDLIEALHARSHVSAVVLRLKDSSPEADIRISMRAEKGQNAHLLGLVTLLQDDVTQQVRLASFGREEVHPPDCQCILCRH